MIMKFIIAAVTAAGVCFHISIFAISQSTFSYDYNDLQLSTIHSLLYLCSSDLRLNLKYKDLV